MSYHRTDTLIARRGYGANGRRMAGGPQAVGFLDTLKEFGGKVLSFYGQTQQTKGEASAYAQMLAAEQARRAQTPSWIAPVAIGGAVVAAVLLLRKKKSA